MECKCDLHHKLAGDGCEACNPAFALDCAGDTIESQSAEITRLTAEVERLREQNDINMSVASSACAAEVRLTAEVADLRMQLDSSCNAEELRQARAEVERLRELLSQPVTVQSMGMPTCNPCDDKFSTSDQFESDMVAMNVPRVPLATLIDGPAGSQVILPTCKPCDDELVCSVCGKTYFRGLQHAGWRQRPDGSEYAVVGCSQACVDAQ